MRKEEKIQALTHITQEQARPYTKLNENQWNVYFYLLSISDYNSLKREDHRYVYKSEISPTKIAKAFGFQPRTYYNIIKALQGKGLLSDQPKYFLLPLPEAYTTIPRPLLSQLLAYRERMTIDLLRTYLVCRAIYDKYGLSKAISIRNIVGCLGHSLGRSEYYRTVELSLDLLINWGLVKYKTEWREDEKIGKYRVYRIYEVLDESPELNFRGLEEHVLSGKGDLSKEEEEHIRKIIGEDFY